MIEESAECNIMGQKTRLHACYFFLHWCEPIKSSVVTQVSLVICLMQAKKRIQKATSGKNGNFTRFTYKNSFDPNLAIASHRVRPPGIHTDAKLNLHVYDSKSRYRGLTKTFQAHDLNKENKVTQLKQ